MSFYIEKKREARACTKCGYVRKVMVAYYADDRQPPRWQKLCTACDLERRAENHLGEYRYFTRRASEQRRKQAARKAS